MFIKCINDNSINALNKIEDNSIDLILTSPPYDNLRTYNGITWNFDIFKQIANHFPRILKKGGVIVWIVNDMTVNGSETLTSFKQALYFKEHLKLNIHDTMIWRKSTTAFPCKNRYYQIFEYMFIFSKGKPKTINLIEDRKNKHYNTKVHGSFRQADGKLKRPKKYRIIKEYGVRFNVWDITEEKHNKTGHPAVFPYKLAYDHIISWSKENDVILDPFMGSGTTAIACIDTKRNFIGIELNDEYFNIGIERIKKHITKDFELIIR